MPTIKKEDRRVRRTKKNLRDNLFVLLNAKPINQITVTQLTNLADINRSTFYLYYNDIYDMIDKIHEEIYIEFTGRVESYGKLESVEYLTKCLQFCKENPNVCKFIVDEQTGNQLAIKIRDSILSFVLDSTTIFEENDARRYSSCFFSSGVFAVIHDWINDDMAIPADDLARFLNQLYKIAQKSKNDV
ncbi:MAG: TetR-like C-terminal domain-containing protein [Clostridia bacterium]